MSEELLQPHFLMASLSTRRSCFGAIQISFDAVADAGCGGFHDRARAAAGRISGIVHDALTGRREGGRS